MRSRILWITAGLAACWIVFYFVHFGRGEKSNSAPLKQAAQTTGEAAADTSLIEGLRPGRQSDFDTISSSVATRMKGLPETDIELSSDPLLDRIQPLKDRAMSGDYAASTQLALELYRCAKIPTLLTGSERALDAADGSVLQGAQNEDLNAANAYLLEADENKVICADVPAAVIDERYRWLERAAEGGDARAVLKFIAEGSLVAENPDAAFKDPEEVIRFKRKAIEVLESSARQCQVPSMMALGRSYVSGIYGPKNEDVGEALVLVANRLHSGNYQYVTPHPPSRAEKVVGLAVSVFQKYCK